MQPGDVKIEVLEQNKWARMGLNGTVSALLTIDRPVRVKVSVNSDFTLEVLVFEGLDNTKETETPIARLGFLPIADVGCISHLDGSLTSLG